MAGWPGTGNCGARGGLLAPSASAGRELRERSRSRPFTQRRRRSARCPRRAGSDSRKAGRDHPAAVALVVEGEYEIVKTNGEIRRRQVVEVWPWQAFEMVAQVVAEQAGGAALERRQVRQRFCAPAPPSLGQHQEWVT